MLQTWSGSVWAEFKPATPFFVFAWAHLLLLQFWSGMRLPKCILVFELLFMQHPDLYILRRQKSKILLDGRRAILVKSGLLWESLCTCLWRSTTLFEHTVWARFFPSRSFPYTERFLPHSLLDSDYFGTETTPSDFLVGCLNKTGT